MTRRLLCIATPMCAYRQNSNQGHVTHEATYNAQVPTSAVAAEFNSIFLANLAVQNIQVAPQPTHIRCLLANSVLELVHEPRLLS